MKKKTSNSSGFTLVELMVVMCLMGIIMGAILNFIQPTAELYKNTNAYLSEEEATTTVYNYLQDDLMYVTAVYIRTSSSDDIAEVIDEVYDDSGVNLLTTPYTNCIRLDNVSVRTNGTDAAETKGATGSISKYALYNSQYVDVATNSSLLSGNSLFLNSFSLQDQSFLDDKRYVFGIGHKSGSDAISVMIDVYSPAYSSSQGQYVFRENAYSAKKSIEFLNATVQKMTADPVYDIADMSMEPEAPTPYIYIFYGRKPKIQVNAINVNYECYLMNHEGEWFMCYSGSAPEGSDVYDDVFKAVEEYNIARVEKEPYVYQRMNKFSFAIAVDDYDEDDPYYDLHNLDGRGGRNIQLYMVYSKTLKSDMPPLTLNFYRNATSTDPTYGTYTVEYGGDFIISDTVHSDLNDPLGTRYESDYWRKTTVWANKDNDEEFINLSHITNNINAYLFTYDEYLVFFTDDMGNRLPWTRADGSDGSAGYWVRNGEVPTEFPDLSTVPADEGMMWIWDESNQDFDDPVADGPIEFIARQEPIPEEPEEPEPEEPEEPEEPVGPNPGPGGGSSVDISWGYNGTESIWTDRERQLVKHKITITNNSGTFAGGSTITLSILYNCNITLPPYNGPSYSADWNAGISSVSYSLSGNDTLQVVIKIADASNPWDPTFDYGEYIIFNSAVLYDDGASPSIVAVLID